MFRATGVVVLGVVVLLAQTHTVRAAEDDNDDEREPPQRERRRPDPEREAAQPGAGYSPYPTGQYPAAPRYYPPIYSRRVFKERLAICPLGDGEWSFCHMHNGKTVGENTFIERYHQITGNPSLDEYMDTSWKQRPLATAGGLFAAFSVMTIAGWVGVWGVKEKPVFDAPAFSAALAFGSIGVIGVFATLVIGFPIAGREPRGRHTMSQETARRAVREYNAALQREMGGY